MDDKVRIRRRKEKEKEARDLRRHQARAEALVRLEAQQSRDERIQLEEEQEERRKQISLQRGRAENASCQDQEVVEEGSPREGTEGTIFPDKEPSEAAEKESKRVRELEDEVERLRRELEIAKEQNELSRHVHFAPTPPASDLSTPSGEMSFLSISSSSYHPPAPPLPPPPPPVALAAAKASSIAIVAAHKAALKSSPSRKKPPAAGVGMPLDMGKFLSEMKHTKLKKVGLPQEGKQKKKDDEETGLKAVLGELAKPTSIVSAEKPEIECSQKTFSNGVSATRIAHQRRRSSLVMHLVRQ